MLRHAPAWERAALVSSARLQEAEEGRPVRVGGRVRRVVETRTRRDEPMAFVEIEDPWGEFEVVLFPQAFARVERALLVPSLADVVRVEGVVERGRGVARVRGERVEALALDARATVVPLAPSSVVRRGATGEAQVQRSAAAAAAEMPLRQAGGGDKARARRARGGGGAARRQAS
jgi:DNA polymerase III alpha subunit